jgi:hypothetical protein
MIIRCHIYDHFLTFKNLQKLPFTSAVINLGYFTKLQKKKKTNCVSRNLSSVNQLQIFAFPCKLSL